MNEKKLVSAISFQDYMALSSAKSPDCFLYVFCGLTMTKLCQICVKIQKERRVCLIVHTLLLGYINTNCNQ